MICSMCLSDYVLNNNICYLKCADKDNSVSAASGVLPGLGTANATFNWHYAKALRGYMKAVSPVTPVSRVKCPFTSVVMDTRSTNFVDDLNTSFATYENSQVLSMSKDLDEQLDAQFERLKFTQNHSKANAIARTF
eukprot:1134851-Karenia_brevis.AAC.1